jgi:hypothetical protein
MGVPLDRSFVPVVPLGGRYVKHFWRLLEGLEIPYATLLDLDLGRRHGGALNLQSTIATLQEFGRDLSLNRSVREGEIDLDNQDDIEDAELLAEDQEHPWLKALRRERVYFSSPIDLDFAMLLCFPDAYKLPHEGGLGPRASAQAIGRKKEDTLKTGGNPQLYGAEYDTDFAWYPYLFLATSKPEIHLAALSRIEDQALARNAPPELRRLITRIQNALR